MSFESHQQQYFEDPFKPRIEDQAAAGSDFVLPWKKANIELGAREYAFNRNEGRITLTIIDNSTVNMREVDTSTRTETADHQSFALSIEANAMGGMVSATGKGAYDHHVSKNSDEQKISLHSSFRAGMITWTDTPCFTSEAYYRVPTRLDRLTHLDNFTPVHGTHYVGGLILGADNAALVSRADSAESESHTETLSVKVKALCVSKTVSTSFTQQTASEERGLSLTGFDTLRDYVIPPPDMVLLDPPTMPKMDPMNLTGFIQALVTWESQLAAVRAQRQKLFTTQKLVELVEDGRSIEARVADKMKELGLGSGSGPVTITPERCREICESGLVCEILLVPFSKCEDFVVARNRREFNT